MMTAQDFANAVDSLTGQVAFTLPLMALPGPASLPVSIALAYGSAVADTVGHWNLTNPTGVVGLGWSLPRSAILASGAYGADLGDSSLTLVLGGATTALIPTGDAIGDAQQWLAVTQPFWQVSFDADAGTWTVIDENGTIHRFGQPAGAGPGATQYAVTIGDWVASSNLAAPQAQTATGWDLASITDLFGNQCQFFYESVTSTLTDDGLAYTQASYLTRIVGAWGDAIELAYVDKQAFEYALPYTDPDPPNAWQALIETKALQSVVLIPADRGSALVTATLAYATSFNAVDATDTAYNKRTLTGVTFSFPDAYAQPPLEFAYVASGAANAGALASVTTLAGSVVTYSYGAVAGLQYSARSAIVARPVVSGVTFTILELLFEESFAVALWSGSDASLVIAPYRWEGRWLAGAATGVASATADAATVLTAASANLFGVIAAGTLYSFYRDPRTPDDWIAGTITLTASAPTGTTGYQLAAGDRFLAVLYCPSGSLYRVDFASLAWDGTSVPTTLASQNAYALAAQGNKLLVVGATADTLSVWIDTRGVTGAWTAGTDAISATLGSQLGLEASFCGAGAAILAGGTLGGDPRYSAFATAFDASGAPGDLAVLTSGAGTGSLATFGMTVKVAAFVARYDGDSWIPADLGSFGMPAGATLASTSFGQDVAARGLTLTDGSSQYQLFGFDADQGAWVLRATAGAPANGAGVAIAPRTPLAPSRYAVLGNSLYYMSSDQSWAAVAGAALPAIAAGDAGTVQVLGNDYLLFQTSPSSATTAWFLGNGGSMGTATATASIQAGTEPADFLVGTAAFATYQGDWNAPDMVVTLRRPVALAIDGLQSGLVVQSVAVTSGYSSDAAIVTIPGAAAQATVELLGDTHTAYEFLALAATVTPDGALPLFNGASSLPTAPSGTTASAGSSTLYLFNGLAQGETAALTAPSNALYENSETVPSIVAGLTYTAIATTSADTTASQQDAYWWGTVTPQPAGFTVYARPRRSVTTLDGVATTLDATYGPATGFPGTLISSYVDGSGATIATTQSLSYFPDHYSATPSPNILSPVIESTTTVTTTPAGGSAGAAETVAATATTWRQDWGGGVSGWAPAMLYRQAAAGAAAFNAWATSAATPSGWQQLLAVTERTRTGIAIGGIDGNPVDGTGVASAAIVDRLDRFAYAQVTNADGASFSYFGCEPYEVTSGWSVLSGGSLDSYLTTGDAHTGTTSLTLPPRTGSGQFVNYLQPTDPGQIFVFGCWARSPAGFDASGSATATVTAYWTEAGTSKQAALATLTLSASAASPWTYFQTLLDFEAALGGATPDAGSFTCKILLANTNTTASLLLDELRFTPMMGSFGANVLDTALWLPSAQIGTNGQSVAAVYDGWMRPVAAIGPDDQVLGATFSGLSRQLSGTGDAFNPGWPNATVTLTPGGATQYDDFSRDTAANWHFSVSGAWTIASGLLRYAAASTGTETLGSTATPVTANTANFAARVIVAPATGSSPAIGDGTIFLRWDAAANSGKGQFTLVALGGDGQSLTTLQLPNTAVPFAGDWLFVAIDGFYYCAVGGVFLFAYIRDAGAPAGAGLMLASNGSADFDDLIRLDDPGVSIGSFDAMARPVQQLGLIGGTPSGTTNKIAMQVATQFYDSFGRQVVLGLPQTGTLTLTAATGSLPAPAGVTAGDVADTGTTQMLPDGAPTEYLVASGDGATALEAFVETGVTVSGMAATQLLYNAAIAEPSPLGRPQSALPTRSTANGNGTGYQRSWQYQGKASLLPATTPATPLVYRQAQATVETAIDGTGAAIATISGEIRAQDGRLLQQYQGPSAAPATLLQTFTYHPAGQLASRTQANAAAPPTGTVAATWTETFAYDFLGRLTEQNSPDSGITQYAYDSADRLRFYIDADGAAASPQRINYIRYDRIGRPVEQGWIASSAYGWDSSALTGQLDDQGFPNVPGGTGTGATVTGRWRRQFTYDSDGNTTTRNLLGRLWQAASEPDTGTATTSTTYTYDADGRVVGTTETLSTGGSAATTAYAYTPAGQLAAITYPTLDANGFSVGYYYDRLGRLTGVGEPSSADIVVDPSQPTPEIAVRYAAYAYGSAGQVSAIGLNQPATAQAPAFTRQLAYQNLAQVTQIADPYMRIDLGYLTGDGTTGATPRLGSSTITYQVSSNWTTPPTAFGFSYSYDGLGRLTAAAAQQATVAAFGFQANASDAYDANGNRGAWNRGITAYSGSYPQIAVGGTGLAPGVPANGLTAIQPLIQNTETFAGASGSSAGFWSWGSNNGGPSTSALVAGTGGTQSLKLGGGNALGHYEQLVLDTWLDPAADLTLQVSTSTDAGYPGAGSAAAWTLTLFGPGGAVATTTLAYVPASATPGTGTSQTVPVDVAAAIADSGYAGEVTRAQLSLQNVTQSATPGTAGPALYVQSLALAWSSPPSWAYGYDGTGSVTSEQQQGLNAIAYDYLSYQATGLTTPAASQTWLRDASGRSVLTNVTETADSSTVSVQNHYDLAGQLIAQGRTEGTTTSVSYFVNGPGGMIAAQQDGALLFALGDQFGSIRALVDGSSNAALGSFDYQPFGGLARASGDDAALARFTNHGLDPAGSLIPTPARLLTPSSGRFLQVDPRYDGLSPYAYALNDPVNLVDPTGAIPMSAIQWVGALTAAGSGLVQFGLIANRFYLDPWEGGVATVSAMIGVAAPYVAIRSSPWLQRRTSALLVHSRRLPSVVVSAPWILLRAGGWFLQREVAGYTYLAFRALAPSGNATTSPLWEPVAVPARLIGQVYGTANLFILYAVGQNARWETFFRRLPRLHINAQHANLPVFIPGTGNPDFEAYATDFFWLWPTTLAGNTALPADVLRTYQAHGRHVTYANLGANQLTLQHDMMPDLATVIDRNSHTTRYGGPAHIGSSAFIREGYAIPMSIYGLTIDALNLIPSLSDQGPLTYRLTIAILGMQRGNSTSEF